MHDQFNTPEPLKPMRRRTRVRQTSRDAYRLLGRGVNTQAALIYAAIVNAGAEGLTDREGEESLGMRTSSYTARRCLLANMGVIRDSGRRRLTCAGRNAIVWEATRADDADAPPQGSEGGAG